MSHDDTLPDPARAAEESSRRAFMASLAVLGAGVAATGVASSAEARAAAPGPASDGSITSASIAEAEKLAGITFTEAERAQIARTVAEHLETFRARAAFGPLDNALAPAQVFRVLLPGESVRVPPKPPATGASPLPPIGAVPADDAGLDFATVRELSHWIHAGTLTSRRLVARSLARLEGSRSTLFHVITLLREQALAEADARDAEARAGKFRGPLHGIPYGLKDLFDTAGIATTWGAEPWRERVPTGDAAVVARLREAGAVCVAKTAVGALAYGDIWFGGTCRNPWKPEQGSSGSSAGSASAVAAGCVPFAIGTETLGSIVSPSVRCGTTGLRPTFGSVARDGCMALCWSWDKIGPIVRSVPDAMLVLAAIGGASHGDASSVDPPPSWRDAPSHDARGLRFAYDPSWFEGPGAALRDTLAAARTAGIELVERKFTPPGDPGVLVTSLMAEAASAFEDMTRSGQDDQLSWQADEAWPNSFRKTWFVPATELVQAERLRRRFMTLMREALDGVDGLILPPFAGGLLFITNATGHPQLVLRAGFDAPDSPRSISLIGHPFEEATLARAGWALEAALAVAQKRPEMPWFAG